MTHWVVVGGGTAGCVVAAGLSAAPHLDVTLVEAGADGGPRRTSASSLSNLEVSDAVWPDVMARYGDSPFRPYLQGRGLGGSSRINGAIVSGVAPGTLPAEEVGDDELGPIDQALLAAAPDARRVLLTRRDGRLVGPADVHLTPARERGNLAVRTGVTVTAISFVGRRAVGVTCSDGSSITADHVALCAGALQSPAILMRSGVIMPRLGSVADHAGVVIDLVLGGRFGVDPGSLVTGVVLRRGGVEIVPLNHVGAAAPDGAALAGRAALLVGWLGSPLRGWVVLDAADRAGPPQLHLDDPDARTAAGLAEAMALAGELLGSRAFGEVVVDASVAPSSTAYFHVTSSCAGVVDEHGSMRGYERLHIADASVLPPLAAGPYGAVVATAERLARRWADHSS